jgi:hypothetical protein
MTALQVAKQECANCDSAGNCAGVGIRDDGSLYRFRREREKCWLAPGPDGAIARCPYFEECVAPAANERLRNAATAEQRIRAKSFADGVREYEMAVLPAPVSAKFRCASAGCRRTVLRPTRFCPKHGENRSRTAENANFAHSR